MNKSELKKFAIYSREKLIEDIKNKAMLIGITEEGINSPLSESTQDMLAFDIGEIETHKIYGQDVRKYKKLIIELERKQEEIDYKTAYKVLIEEIAYTWFNRIIAIRFMEVNNYMPDKLRILSSGKEGVKEPEFITHYRDTDIGITNQEFEKLDELKLDGSSKAMEDIFQFLFIKQCNKLNEILPELFEKTNDYSELLLNISYNDPEGVIYKLIEDIGEEPFDTSKTGQIEIIGWLYQYYNEDKKNKVINIYKGNVEKEDLPAATQLFTTEWVVKYMVENSIGKYWLERNPDSKLKNEMEYFMPGDIKYIDEKISPEDLKILDNAMGSGHILVYTFEILMKIYLEEGYMERDAAEKIIEKNLYGLDIDKRAYQLAYFSIMMKARQYSRRILNNDIENNLLVFEDSTDIDDRHLEFMGLSMNGEQKEKATEYIKYLIKEFENAKEIGSILKIKDIDLNLLRNFINDINKRNQVSFNDNNIEYTKEKLNRILKIVKFINQKYDSVITNPPYLNKMSSKLKKYVVDNYKDYKRDLFCVFLYNNIEMCKQSGYASYMTPNVWMFIQSYVELRDYIIENKHIDSLIQISKGSFYKEATVDVITFIIKNEKNNNKGKYIRLENFKGNMEIQRIKTLEAINNVDCGYYYETNEDNFKLIPGEPIAYWVSDNLIKNYEKYKLLGNLYKPRQGMATCDNKRFLRLWFEVSNKKIKLNCSDIYSCNIEDKKWFPYNKGGRFRNWYGNNEYLINWEKDGQEVKDFAIEKYNSVTRTIKNIQFYFKECITYTFISSSKFGVRYSSPGFIFDVAGSSIFLKKEFIDYLLGLLGSKVTIKYLELLNPTLNYQVGDIKNLPLIFSDTYKSEIDSLVQQNISISKTDWDSFETSWDFEIHPFLDKEKQGNVPDTIESSYENWKSYANSNFSKLKENEERLNEIFIEIYGLEDELTPEVSDKDITIAKIFNNKNEIYDDIKGNKYILTKEDVIKSFISYGVGCIFGRYSLNKKGLIYAGGEFDINKYNEFKPVEDNIVLITDQEYFEDDLVNRFIQFLKISFGEENLEENLNFIAGSLKGKGTSREKLRNYFIKDFYKDHVQTYKKRPIYWLYDSGKKQNAFKALIYMHRYNEDTTGKVRIDYLHELQKVYERKVDFLRDDILNNKDAKEVSRSEKELNKITKQIKECKDYDEKIGHISLLRIPIDLDDGVKVNYEKVQTDDEGNKYKILDKI